MDILLIDDSVTDLRLLMDLMLQRKYSVSVAFDGHKGYQLAVMHKPSLILLDVSMPGMDGFAVCRRLKANPQTCFIPVIFLTAATELSERLLGFAVGGVDYISKPFDAEEVLARVGVHKRLVPIETVASDSPAQTTGGPDDEPEAMTRDQVIVAAAQKLLQSHLASPPTLENVARQVGTNRRQLNEAFQNVCGLPVFGWLREERLREGHYLVAQTDTPISMVGEYLGYSTSANFAKAFRERFGCAPRDLRSGVQTHKVLEQSNAEA